MASFYPMYDFAVKVGGDCLMLIWQHFGKKEVYYIISAWVRILLKDHLVIWMVL